MRSERTVRNAVELALQDKDVHIFREYSVISKAKAGRLGSCCNSQTNQSTVSRLLK